MKNPSVFYLKTFQTFFDAVKANSDCLSDQVILHIKPQHTWIRGNEGQIPQIEFFRTCDIDSSADEIKAIIGLPLVFEKKNTSTKYEAIINENTLREIEDFYQDDFLLYNSLFKKRKQQVPIDNLI